MPIAQRRTDRAWSIRVWKGLINHFRSARHHVDGTAVACSGRCTAGGRAQGISRSTRAGTGCPPVVLWGQPRSFRQDKAQPDHGRRLGNEATTRGPVEAGVLRSGGKHRVAPSELPRWRSVRRLLCSDSHPEVPVGPPGLAVRGGGSSLTEDVLALALRPREPALDAT